MRIGELATALGVSTDTLRFYERSGMLPRPRRADNGYRDYSLAELERLRLMLDLRRLDVPLADAARMAGWCQSGHCATTSAELPRVLRERRHALRQRIAGLRVLDRRLAELESHLLLNELPMAAEARRPCCTAAAALEEAITH